MKIPKYAQQIEDRISEYELEVAILSKRLANTILNHVKTRERLARKEWLLQKGIPVLAQKLESLIKPETRQPAISA